MEAPGTFSVQMRKYFGFRPGETASDFLKELKALDADDRAEFTRLLNAAGYPVVETAKV